MMRPWFPHPMWNLWPWKRVSVKCGCKSRQQVMPLKSTWMRIVQHPLNRKTKVRILCFEFAYTPLRFCLAREIDTKIIRAKRWAICKTSIFEQYLCISLQIGYNSGSKLFLCKCLSCERKSERIERKFKTQNPILKRLNGTVKQSKMPFDSNVWSRQANLFPMKYSKN